MCNCPGRKGNVTPIKAEHGQRETDFGENMVEIREYILHAWDARKKLEKREN